MVYVDEEKYVTWECMPSVLIGGMMERSSALTIEKAGTATIMKLGGMWMKRFAMIPALMALLFLAACSGGEEAEEKEKTRIYDTEQTALEEAKKVESLLLKSDEERQEEIKTIEEN